MAKIKELRNRHHQLKRELEYCEHSETAQRLKGLIMATCAEISALVNGVPYVVDRPTFITKPIEPLAIPKRSYIPF